MAFEKMGAEQYRALDLEELEARRQAVIDELDDPKSEVATEELRGESELVRAEFKRRSEAAELRSLKLAAVAAGQGEVIARTAPEEPSADPYGTDAYMGAFMEYACRGKAIPAELRASEATTTADAGAVIPTKLMSKIVAEADTYGNIWSKVTKLNVKGGVEYPILSLKPTATWIGETEVSDYQKLQSNTKISFSYYGLECRVAQTLLASVTTIEEFQRLFVPLATEAMVKALEAAIISGDGNGKFLGYTQDSRIPAANVIEMTPEELASWESWHKKVKAKMKKAYRNGEFIMAQASFDGYIDGMVDKNGQPVGRVNYGINGEESYRFMGKTVETVEESLVKDFETAEAGDVIAIFTVLTDYAVNSNLQMRASRWFDEETNQHKNKLILIADGKLVDPYGTLLIKKKASA